MSMIAGSLPIFLAATGVLLALLAVFTWQRRHVGGARSLTLLLPALAVYSLGTAGELLSPDLSQALAWTHFQYLGISVIPVLTLRFALEYTGVELRHRRVRAVTGLLLFIAAIVVAAQLSTGVHNQYYQNLRLRAWGPISSLAFDTGPIYILMQVAMQTTFLASMAILLRRVWRTAGIIRAQASMVAAGLLLTIAAEVFYLAGLTPAELDLTPTTFVVAMLIVMWGLFSTSMFGLKPAAMRVIFGQMPTACIVLDRSHQLVESNAAAREMFPHLRQLPVGTPVDRLFPDSPALLSLATVGASAALDTTFSTLPGRWFHVQRTNISAPSSSGTILMVAEVTERVRAARRLEELASRDTLTGTLNRRSFFAMAEETLSVERSRDGWVSVLMIDIDHFKHYNDTHGHHAGDKILRATTERIGSALRASDLLGRYGGEEFAVLLPATPRSQAMEVAERIRLSVADLNTVTISVGVAAVRVTGDTALEPLMERADRALYAAKRTGRNRVVTFRPNTELSSFSA